MEKELTTREKLLNAILAPAKWLLEENDNLIPFGAMITKDGEAKLGTADDTKLKNGEGVEFTQEVIDRIVVGHKKEAEKGNLSASAICAEVLIHKDGVKKDAICVDIEVEGEKPVKVFIPYLKDSSGKIIYDDLIAEGMDAKVFI